MRRLFLFCVQCSCLALLMSVTGCARHVKLSELQEPWLQVTPAGQPEMLFYVYYSLGKSGCVEVPGIEARLNGVLLNRESDGRKLPYGARGDCMVPTFWLAKRGTTPAGGDRLSISDGSRTFSALYADLTTPRSARLVSSAPVVPNSTVVVELTPKSDQRTAVNNASLDYSAAQGVTLLGDRLSFWIPPNTSPGKHRLEATFEGKLALRACEGFTRCDDDLVSYTTVFEFEVAAAPSEPATTVK